MYFVFIKDIIVGVELTRVNPPMKMLPVAEFAEMFQRIFPIERNM